MAEPDGSGFPGVVSRQRVGTIPIYRRFDRAKSLPSLGRSSVPERVIRPDDEDKPDLLLLSGTFSGIGASDDLYDTSALVFAGWNVLSVRVKYDAIEERFEDIGWRLYATPVAPSSVSDLLDEWEVYPILRGTFETRATAVLHSTTSLRRTSPADRRRNFDAFISFRWTQVSGLGVQCDYQITIRNGERSFPPLRV